MPGAYIYRYNLQQPRATSDHHCDTALHTLIYRTVIEWHSNAEEPVFNMLKDPVKDWPFSHKTLSLKTGGLCWQVQLYWNVGLSARNIYGPARHVDSHGSIFFLKTGFTVPAAVAETHKLDRLVGLLASPFPWAHLITSKLACMELYYNYRTRQDNLIYLTGINSLILERIRLSSCDSRTARDSCDIIYIS